MSSKKNRPKQRVYSTSLQPATTSPTTLVSKSKKSVEPVAPPTLTLDVSEVLLEIAMSKFRDENPGHVWEHATVEVRQTYVDQAGPIFEKIWKR